MFRAASMSEPKPTLSASSTAHTSAVMIEAPYKGVPS